MRDEILGNYRRRLDIIADILNAASRNARKTQIMYQANLSYKVLQKYLAEVADAQLISYADKKQHYLLTDKGREFLQVYEKYSRSNKYAEKRLNDLETKKQVLDRLCTDRQC